MGPLKFTQVILHYRRALPLNPPQYITLGIALPSSAKASPALQKFIACTKIVIQSQSHIETV